MAMILFITFVAGVYHLYQKHQRKQRSAFIQGVMYAEDMLEPPSVFSILDLEADLDEAQTFDEFTDFDRGIAAYIDFYEANLDIINPTPPP